MNQFLAVIAVASVFAISIAQGAGAQNLVKNGSFESLEGWEVSNSSLVELSSDAVEGKTCLKITSEPTAPADSESTAAWQMIDMKSFDADGEYRLQFRAKSDRFPQEYNLFMGVMQGQQLPVVIGYEWRQVGPQWQDVQLDFRDMNPVATAVKLIVQVKAPGSVWIDDLKITRLPKGTIGAEDRALKELPKYKGSKTHVQIAPGRRFLVNNKPFFPIGMWGIDFPDENEMKDMQAYGFNVSGTGHLFARKAEGTKELLDMAQSHGLKIIGVMRFAVSGETSKVLPESETTKGIFKPIVEVVRDHPAFFAYDIADEPAWAGNNLPVFAGGAHFFREMDPNHPIFSNQAPRQSISLLQRYYRFVDIGGSDIYPYWNGEPDRHSDLPNKTLSVVGDECRKNLAALGGNKPVLMTIQTFGWSDGNTDPVTKAKGYAYPPQNLLRFMVYDAITAGASGIMLYQDHRYEGIDPRVKPMSLELSAMHDVLAAANSAVQAKPAAKQVKAITKKLGKYLYVIAVNTTDKSLKTRITLPGKEADWSVLFESRKVQAKGSSLADEFEPWGVHIYTNSTDQAYIKKLEARSKGR